jgi:4-diphosphocytidyl-2C-methyl-D-erythritol kinase
MVDADTSLSRECLAHTPAKINWTLRVIAKRPDGFHEIESLVSTVTLYD